MMVKKKHIFWLLDAKIGSDLALALSDRNEEKRSTLKASGSMSLSLFGMFTFVDGLSTYFDHI